ncbi:MAG TPA: Ig-like domain repeat protein, partial [Acidobacteriaceae bacterium]
MTTNPSVTRSRSLVLRAAILFTALAVPAVAQILAGHSTLFPRWASAAAHTIAAARAHVPALQMAKQSTPKSSAHPNSSQPGAQIHFVPEVLHVIAGGDDNSRGNDDPADGNTATSTRLNAPDALAVDPAGNVYIADIGNAQVYRVNTSDGTMTTIAGTPVSTDEVARRKADPKARLRTNTALAHGNVIPGTQVSLGTPSALALGPSGELYIADGRNAAIYKLDTSGNMTIVAGTEGSDGYSPDGTLATGAMLGVPNGVTVDTNGQVYFSEAENGVVRRINPADGTLITVAGNQAMGPGFSGDGAAAISAQLNNPAGLVFLPNGNLVVADSENFVVRQVNASTGVITTIAGRNRSGYSGDGGAGTAARLSTPQAVATDAAGQIYIADVDNKVVRKLALDGTISTIAGHKSSISLSNYGPFGVAATDASITSTAAVAIGPAGEVYVAGEDIGIVAKLGPDLLLDFGQQQIHSVITRTLAVENTGTASFTFTGSGFSATGNAYHADSSATNGCTATTTLAPGGVCGIDVSFNPQETGDAFGELTITDSLGTQSATLQGTGVKQYSDTAVTVTPTSANVGDTITFTATVTDEIGSGNPITSGAVNFVDDNTGNTLASASLNSSGQATATTIPGQGSYQVAAYFNGSSQYASSSSGDVELDIAAKPASITLTASSTVANAGSAVAVSASVTSTAGSPTGSVTFLIDGVNIGTGTLTGGTASTDITAPAPGQHTLQAMYSGDSQFGSALSNTLPLTTHGALLQFSPAAATTIAGIPSDD